MLKERVCQREMMTTVPRFFGLSREKSLSEGAVGSSLCCRGKRGPGREIKCLFIFSQGGVWQGIEALSKDITLMLACEKWVKSTGNCLIYMVSSVVTLCDPMDYSLPGSSVHGTLQARMLEWVAISPPPGDLPNPRMEPKSLMPPSLAGGFFTASATWQAPAA